MPHLVLECNIDHRAEGILFFFSFLSIPLSGGGNCHFFGNQGAGAGASGSGNLTPTYGLLYICLFEVLQVRKSFGVMTGHIYT